MKILIITQYYYPEQFQINDIAPELVKRNHEVTLLCGLPNYPQGKIYPGYKDCSKREEVISGVRVVRCKQIPRGNNSLTLLLNYWSYGRNAKKMVRYLDSDFDVVIGYQLSPIMSMYPALEYKKIHGTPLLMYCLDLWPVSVQAHLPIKNGLIYKWFYKVSRNVYNAFDKILVTSKPFIKYLYEVNGVLVERMAYLPQHADMAMLEMDLDAEGNGVVDFMYAGNLGTGSTLDIIVKAAKILGARKDYIIHFVGNGSKKAELEAMVAEFGLQDNFVFHGNQKRSDMPKFYRMADALLITLRGNNEVGDTMPGKLQMYMTVGKPILGAINGAANEVIKEAECGCCVKAGDYKGLANLMEDYISNPHNYNFCGNNARKYFVKNFTLGEYMNGLEIELCKLVK